jgi:hypothetical protein
MLPLQLQPLVQQLSGLGQKGGVLPHTHTASAFADTGRTMAIPRPGTGKAAALEPDRQAGRQTGRQTDRGWESLASRAQASSTGCAGHEVSEVQACMHGDSRALSC